MARFQKGRESPRSARATGSPFARVRNAGPRAKLAAPKHHSDVEVAAASMTENLALARAEAHADAARGAANAHAASTKVDGAAAMAQRVCAEIMGRAKKPSDGAEIIVASTSLMLELCGALLTSGAVPLESATVGCPVADDVLAHISSFLDWVQSNYLDGSMEASTMECEGRPTAQLRTEVAKVSQHIDALTNGSGSLRTFVAATKLSHHRLTTMVVGTAPSPPITVRSALIQPPAMAQAPTNPTCPRSARWTVPQTGVVKHLATRGTAPKPPSRNGNGRPLTSCGQKQPFASPRSRPVSHRQCNATATTAAPITGSDQALVTYRVSLICELMEIQSSHSLV
jgi:hypothetical protein